MIIKKIDLFPVVFARSEPLRIATGTSSSAPNVFVRLISEKGTTGWGSAAANSVTKESSDSIVNAIQMISGDLKGAEFRQPNDVWEYMKPRLTGNPSAKAAVDMAVYDIFSRDAGLPLYRYLRTLNARAKNKPKSRIISDRTIGIMTPKETLQHAEYHQKEGFRALKLKAGEDLEADIKRIADVRKLVGKRMRLRVDANQGFSAKEAIELACRIEPLGIEFIEQPVSVSNLSGLGRVTKSSPVPIMADESMRGSRDAEKIIRGRYADLLNVKLMKCGGITDALNISGLAEKNGTGLMVGCMGESRLSVCAGLHFALSQGQVRFADLDSHLSIIGDFAKGGFEFRDGYLVPLAGKNGLGVDIRF